MSYHYCFDENINKHLVNLLLHLRHPSVTGSHITDHLAPGTLDPAVISFISENEWILVSGDPKMRKDHADALSQNKIRALFMPEPFMMWTGRKQSIWLLTNWDKIQERVEAEREDWQHLRITEKGGIRPMDKLGTTGAAGAQ